MCEMQYILQCKTASLRCVCVCVCARREPHGSTSPPNPVLTPPPPHTHSFPCALHLSYTGAIASESSKGDAPCSGYMTGLEEAITAANRHQLSGLPEGPIVDGARVTTATRLVTVFIRLAAMVSEVCVCVCVCVCV
jgi:hypothetical protein